MKLAITFGAIILLLPSVSFSQTRNMVDGNRDEQIVFRHPFLLRLKVDNEHYYEQTFDHIPYVADNDVYLFAGEAFGINVVINENEISRIIYQPDLAKADVELRFKQEKAPNGWMMMLTLRNKLKQRLYLDALMTIPGQEGILTTNVVPVESSLSDFESWPHPIIQLVLRNLRFAVKSKQSDGPGDVRGPD